MHSFAKKLSVLCVLCVLSAGSVYGQNGFQEDKIYVGPSFGYVGFGGLGFGVNGEYGINENIGVGLDAFYSSFSIDFASAFGGSSGSPKFNYTLFGGIATGTYHFSPKKKFDPFVKLGVGIFKWDATYTVDGKEQTPLAGVSAAYTTGLGYIGQLGARYHFSPSMSARVAIGSPFLFSAGVDLAFGGPEVAAKPTAQDTKTSTDTAASSTTSRDRYGIYLGLYGAAKGAFNVNIPDGRKGGPGFGADYGATIYFPFGAKSSLGAGIDIGSGMYKYVNKPNELPEDATIIDEEFGYLTVAPSLNLAGFRFGVLFGVPMSASAKNRLGTSVAGSTIDDSASFAQFQAQNPFGSGVYDPDISKFLATVVEFRLGGMIPILNDQTGRLDVNIQAGYVLTGLYDSYSTYSYTQLYDVNGRKRVDSNGKFIKDATMNPQPITISIGLSYLFKIPVGN